MSKREEIDLAYRLLDLDLVDCGGRRCGKVDDIELVGEPGEPTYVSAVISGPGALPGRMRPFLRPLAKRIFGSARTRVPAGAIEDHDAVLELNRTARELGLGEGDRRLAELLGERQEERPR
jgi:hypothetical protein